MESTTAQETASVVPLPQTASTAVPTQADPAFKPVALAVTDDKVAGSIASLERIDRVAFEKIVKRNGHTSYVMEVFLRKSDVVSQKTPDALAAHANPLVGQQLEANYQVDHRFSEFTELRFVLWYVSRLQGGKVHAKSCPLCKQVLESVECSFWQPSLWTRLMTTQRMRREMLAKFMTKIVAIAVSSRSGETRTCDAHYHLPVLVERFLRKPKDGAHGII